MKKFLTIALILAMLIPMCVIAPTATEPEPARPDWLITEVSCDQKPTEASLTTLPGYTANEDCFEAIEIYNNSGKTLNLYDYCVTYNGDNLVGANFQNVITEITPFLTGNVWTDVPGNFLDGTTIPAANAAYAEVAMKNPQTCEVAAGEVVVIWVVYIDSYKNFGTAEAPHYLTEDDFRAFWNVPAGVKIIALDGNSATGSGGNDKNFNMKNSATGTYGIAKYSAELNTAANTAGATSAIDGGYRGATSPMAAWATVDYNSGNYVSEGNRTITFAYDFDGASSKYYRRDFDGRNMATLEYDADPTFGTLTAVQKITNPWYEFKAGDKVVLDYAPYFSLMYGNGAFAGWKIDNSAALYRVGNTYVATAGTHKAEAYYTPIIHTPGSSGSTLYDSAKDGDTIYTANFNGDDIFVDPTVCDNKIKAEASADGKTLTLSNMNTSANEAEWWGTDTTLPLNDNTNYTIYMSVTRPVGNNSSFGYYFDGTTGFYGYDNKMHIMQYGGTPIAHQYLDYTAMGNDSFTPKGGNADGTAQYYAIEVCGSTKSVSFYVMDTDGAYRLIESTLPGELPAFFSDNLGIVFYIYSKAAVVTVGDFKVCKGLAFNGAYTGAPAPKDAVAISDAAGLLAIQSGINYYLTKDIDLGGAVLTKPLIEEYSGTIDGRGYAIHNFSIEVPEDNAADFGIFRALASNGATVIKNLSIGKAGANIKATYRLAADSKSMGFLAGAMTSNQYLAYFENVNLYEEMTIDTEKKFNFGSFLGYSRYFLMRDCSVNGTIIGGNKTCTGTAYANVAGYVGSHSQFGTSTIIDCVNNADISGYSSTGETRVAGFLTYVGKAIRIINCTNYGNLKMITLDGDTTSKSYVGGIVGHSNKTGMYLKNCVNIGTIEFNSTSPTAYAGGIVAAGTDAGSCIRNCVNYGAINATTEKKGAILGANTKSGVEMFLSGNQDLTGQTPPTVEKPATGNVLVLVLALISVFALALSVAIGSKKRVID